MAARRGRWRWVLFAAIPLVAAGTATVAFSRGEPWHSIGIGTFVAGAGLYVAARVATIVEGRDP